MDKNLIKKNYKKKIELYNYYNKKYYDENISEISDAAFDDLKNENQEIAYYQEAPSTISCSIDNLECGNDAKECMYILKKEICEF